MSDRGNGITASVPRELPLAAHVFCAQHICENMMTRFCPAGDDVRKTFWQLAKASTPDKFGAAVAGMVTFPRGEEIADYLLEIPLDKWATHAMRNPRYGHRTSNIAESINRAWRDTVRESTPLKALKGIWEYLTTKFHERRLKPDRFRSHEYTDFAYSHIQNESKKAVKFHVLPSSPLLYSVSHQNQFYQVDLHSKACSCPDLLEYQLPCSHVLAAIFKAQSLNIGGVAAIRDFVHEAYWKETYIRVYESIFRPVDWGSLTDDDECGPCSTKETKTRLGKKRRVHGHRSYMRWNRCSKCGEQGHNRRSYNCPLYGQREVFWRVPGAQMRVYQRQPRIETGESDRRPSPADSLDRLLDPFPAPSPAQSPAPSPAPSIPVTFPADIVDDDASLLGNTHITTNTTPYPSNTPAFSTNDLTSHLSVIDTTLSSDEDASPNAGKKESPKERDNELQRIDICPLCSRPVDQDFQRELKAVSGFLYSHELYSFCKRHSRRSARQTWSDRGYPNPIDWESLRERCSQHGNLARLLIMGHNCHYRRRFERIIQAREDRFVNSASRLPIPGYYGMKGLSIITFVAEELSLELRAASDDPLIQARGVTSFSHYVLVPEIARRLIMEDMAVDKKDALRIMKKSARVGEILFGEE